MNEPSAPAAPRRRRRLLWFGIVLLVLFGVPAGLIGLGLYRANAALRLAEAELDRTDPGWRLDEIEARRATPPDEENAAVTIQKMRAKMPLNWPTPPLPSTVEPPEGPEDPEPPLGSPPLPTLTLDERLGALPPQVQLDPVLTAELRAALDRIADALAVADALADQKSGRFPINWAPNPINTTLCCQQARDAARPLQMLAALQCQDGRFDAAVRTSRVLLGCNRSIGDEPTLISMLVRISLRALTVRTVERVLAEGTPSEPALAALQRALEADESENLMLHGFRGERAFSHATLEAVKAGNANLGLIATTPGATPSSFLQKVENVGGGVLARTAQPKMLRMLTECVAIAQLPPHEQKRAFDRMEQEIKHADLSNFYLKQMMPGGGKVGQAGWRDRAFLRGAIAAVAAERFRLKNNRWPKGLDELVGPYLSEKLADPYDGKDLRCKRIADGFLIWSIGPDEVDNGGAFSRKAPTAAGTDLVFRLWDPAARRQPPAETLPDPEETPDAPDPDGKARP